MKVIWAKGPVQAREIIRTLQAADPTWHRRTIKTYLNRLLRKRAIGFKKEGRAYVYRPLVRPEGYIGEASEKFLERVFGCVSLKPMLAYFVEHRKLSAKEVGELKDLLDGKGS